MEERIEELSLQIEELLKDNKYHQIREILDDLNEADYVIVMEQSHKDSLMKMFPSLNLDKVYLLLDNVDIEDPWYTNNFSKVYKLINEGCNLWFTKLIGSELNEI